MKRQPAEKKESRPRFLFIRSIIAELKKVAWPSRQDATRLTAIVLCVTLAVAIVLGILDYAFSKFADGFLIK